MNKNFLLFIGIFIILLIVGGIYIVQRQDIKINSELFSKEESKNQKIYNTEQDILDKEVPNKEKDKEETNKDWWTCKVPYFMDTNYVDIDSLKKFNCPYWMQNIYWDRIFSYNNYYYRDSNIPNDNYSYIGPLTTAKFYFYNSLEKKIQRAYLNLITGLIAVIEDPLDSIDEFQYVGYHKIVLIYPDKKIRTILDVNRTPYYTELSNMVFSPNGNYIFFILSGYDVFLDVRLIELESTKNILDGIDLFCSLGDLIWSEDKKWFAINNHYCSYGGEGFHGIVAGELKDGLEAFELVNLDNDSNCNNNCKVYDLSFDKNDGSLLSFFIKYSDGTIVEYVGNLKLKSYDDLEE